MTSPLYNPAFLHHFNQSQAKTKGRMHLKTDRNIDRVYSEVLADLDKFFTFDDGLVKPREVQSDGESTFFSPQSTVARMYNPSLEVITAPNVSQNGDDEFYAFKTSIPKSTVHVTNQLLPNMPEPGNSEPTLSEPQQLNDHSITQKHSSSLPIVKDEIISDSEDNPCAYNEEYPSVAQPQPVNQNVSSMMNYNHVTEECECNDCLNGQPNEEIAQETLNQVKREINEENEMATQQQLNNQESNLAPTFTSLESKNREFTFDYLNVLDSSFGNMHFPMTNDANSNQTPENIKNQYDEVSFANEENESIPHVKKAIMNTTQPPNGQSRIIGQFSKFETQNQSNKQTQPNYATSTSEHQVLTLSVQCLYSGCLQMFKSKHKLDQHMCRAHSIRPFLSVVRHCRQSFERGTMLHGHINQVHRNSIDREWHCDKCSQHFSTYEILLKHNIHHHQLGLFQCSFPSCTFIRECKSKVHDHYKQQHQQTVMNCVQPGCQYQAQKESHLRQHHRDHHGIRSYRCKWLRCDYVSSSKTNTNRHFRRIHMKHNTNSRFDSQFTRVQ